MAVVAAPPWIQIEEVRLLENGDVIDIVDATKGADPVVRVETTLRVEPTADAWYALQVVGSGSLEPVSRSGPPHALTNPIEVDADGDGAWTPPSAP